jgi:hypothetical protein
MYKWTICATRIYSNKCTSSCKCWKDALGCNGNNYTCQRSLIKCPRCLQDNETTDHVLSCREPGAYALWQQLMTDLEIWMTVNYGHPGLIELILVGLKKWHNQERIPYTYDILEPLLKTAWTKQKRFGWTSLIDGFWAYEWRLCQEQYLHRIRSQRSSLLWISRVQCRI